VLGFVHIKDLLKYTDLELGRMPVRNAIRTCLFATADTPADRLLTMMQKEHTLLAIIQEGGNNIGLVTAEDLLEELVGELHDEFDRSKGRIVPGQAAASSTAKAA
jgi:putative hemolysin